MWVFHSSIGNSIQEISIFESSNRSRIAPVVIRRSAVDLGEYDLEKFCFGEPSSHTPYFLKLLSLE